MAGRPRKIKYRDGIIELKNLSVEDADLIEEIIRKSEPAFHPWEQTVDITKLNNLSFSLYKKDNKYFLVTLKFNPENKHCIVDKIEDVGDNYYIATGKLKVLLGEMIFDKLLK